MLELDFTLRNVMLGAALLGVSSGVLGSFALLRQQSLLGDALAHAALPGVCLGFLLSGSREPLPIFLGALVSGALAAAFTLLLTNRSRLKTDAALGISLSLFFAFGLVLLTLIQGRTGSGQAGLEAFLFGQAAAIVPSDVRLMSVVALIALVSVALLWKEFKLLTFDPQFAASLGFPRVGLELVLTSVLAFAIVIGLQLVGVVLMAAIIIAPAAAARQWSESLGQMVGLAALFGALAGVTGAVVSSSGRGLATGPLIVIAASLIALASLLFAPERGLIAAGYRARRARRELAQQRVLLDMYGLAQRHGDRDYLSESGMLGALYGGSAAAQLGRLEAAGLAERTTHMQEEGTHYRLTETGWARAEAVLNSLGNRHA